jgi:rhodanese-related sulfurtransferase
MAALNEISPVNLMRLIGTPQCPVIIDVSTDDDFNDNPTLIPTAVRHAHRDIVALIPTLIDRQVVVTCHQGLKLSHGAAAYLRANGINAQILTGGNVAWTEAKLPRVPLSAIPGTLWVTRHRPKIDRIACPWLIRRFVDPQATFLFVPPSAVSDVADRFNATAFDIEDCDWTHDGEHCTFDVMMKRFGLTHPALDALATVVRAADTDRHDLAPQAAGLLAISVGLSRMFRDDTAQLDAGMLLYDALYRWARDGQDEGHDWPAGRGQ